MVGTDIGWTKASGSTKDRKAQRFVSKGFLRIGLRVVGVVVLLWSGEAILYLRLLEWQGKPEKADAIVVFAGARARIGAGLRLFRQGLAPRIVISPALARQLDDYARSEPGIPRSAFIAEPAARTTFENALITRNLIREHNLGRILLVTSAYHAPRSYVLLRLLTIGSGVEISLSPVTDGSPSRWAYALRHRKILYNEMMKLWGSLAEGAVYAVRGRLPADNPKSLALARALRSLLLFADAAPDH